MVLDLLIKDKDIFCEEYLGKKFELIKNIIFEEEQNYKRTLSEAKTFISKKYNKTGDELMGITEISAEDAFLLYSTHGLSPTQIKSKKASSAEISVMPINSS